MIALVAAACGSVGDASDDANVSASDLSRPNLIEERLEGIAGARLDNDGNATIRSVGEPVRRGSTAFEHRLARGGKRSEFEFARTTIGGTYWQGWSLFVPSDWVETRANYDIVTQWATHPTKRDFVRDGCGGVGSKMSIRGSALELDLQHKATNRDVQCDRFSVLDIGEMKGKWVDFVLHAKWTGNSDGLFQLWAKVGSGPWKQKVDYRGATYWNDEGRGPYFKMGDYKGSADWSGPNTSRVLYTDEYRLGNSNARFEDVSPGGDGLSGSPASNSSGGGASPPGANPPPSGAPPAGGTPPAGEVVTAFADRAYAGASQSFGVGRFASRDGAMDGVGGDAISSLRVPGGMSARLCEHAGAGEGGGVCRSYGPGEHEFVGAELDDLTSFIEVTKP